MSRTLDLPRAIPASTRSARAIWRALGRLITRTVRNGVNAWTVRCTIESLQALDDRTLADIGMHRTEIDYVVRRQLTHFW
jgi:uncharacterized protein YjiS (DUF1127 family)